MDKIKRIIDLKKEKAFIEAYVSLRNRYADLLLTRTVNAAETKEWLKRGDIETRAILWGSDLVGATILYLHREGEITFFVKEPNQGLGSQLLRIIEEVARQERLEYIWGWVLEDNLTAKRAFEKNRFIKEGIRERTFKAQVKSGIVYKKYLLG